MTSPPGEGVPLSDEQLLLDALSRDPGAWKKVKARLDPFLWSIARRRLADLPVDLQEEFLQEVWMRLASRAPEDFDHPAQTARAFVTQFVSAAINKVRADYCPPGKRTRDRNLYDRLVTLAEVGLLEDERAAATFEALAARIDLERMIAVAPGAVQRGVELMMRGDLSTTAAARMVGLPRETYRRKLLQLPDLLEAEYHSGTDASSGA